MWLSHSVNSEHEARIKDLLDVKQSARQEECLFWLQRALREEMSVSRYRDILRFNVHET